MFRVTGICDKCKRQETNTRVYFDNYGWQQVKFSISEYEFRNYLFCDKCRKELGLYPDRRGPIEDSLSKRLFNVIVEIVAESAKNELGN